MVLLCTTAKSCRHTPNGVMLSHLAGTHAPALRTLLPVHERHLPLPEAVHVPHELSHFEHVSLEASKNSLGAHVRTQVPLEVRTGLDALQAVHLSKLPEQLSQSG